MSKALKKISKGIKKVFKKVVKVVKKVAKSKIFQAVVIAVAMYYTGTAIAGALKGSAATVSTAAPSSLGGMSNAIGQSSLAAGGGSAPLAPPAGGILGTIANMSSGAATLGGAVLTTGGQMVSGYAASKAEEERVKDEERKLEINNSTKLDFSSTHAAAAKDAQKFTQGANLGRAELASGNLSPVQQLSNNTSVVNAGKPSGAPQFYNNASDTWDKTA